MELLINLIHLDLKDKNAFWKNIHIKTDGFWVSPFKLICPRDTGSEVGFIGNKENGLSRLQNGPPHTETKL